MAQSHEFKKRKDSQWQEMFIDTGENKHQGVISLDTPITSQSSTYKTIQVNLTNEHIDFNKNNAFNSNNNCYLIDPNLKNIAIVFECRENNTQTLVGIMLVLPHRITYENDENDEKDTSTTIKTCVTTHLCVHRSYREKGIAMLLIREATSFGYKNNIINGYHYIPSPKTASAIDVRPWFRVLNPSIANKYGYSLSFVPKIKSNNIQSIQRMVYLIPQPSTNIQMKATLKTDFKYMKKRLISIAPFDDEEWSDYTSINSNWYTFYNKQILAIAMIRPFILQNNSNNINSCQLGYFEVSSNVTETELGLIFDMILNKCKDDKYIAIHGVMMGVLDKVDFLTQHKVDCLETKTMYLDFYNFGTSGQTNKLRSNDVSLLYI